MKQHKILSLIFGYFLGGNIASYIENYDEKDNLEQRIISKSQDLNSIVMPSISLPVECVKMEGITEHTLKSLKESISEETLYEISNLIIKHPRGTPEAGGVFYLDKAELVFYEFFNNNLDKIKEINNFTNDKIIIDYIKKNLESYTSGYCNISRANKSWSFTTNTIINLLKNNIHENIEKARELFISMMKDSYVATVDNLPEFKGCYIGSVHTHYGFANFSPQDLCLSNYDFKILISHNYPIDKDKFRLYIAFNKKEALLGEYSLVLLK